MTDAELNRCAELLEAERDSWKDWAGVERQRREDAQQGWDACAELLEAAGADYQAAEKARWEQHEEITALLARLRDYEDALRRYENEAPEWLKPIARAALAETP